MAYDGGLPTPFNNSQSGFLVKLGPSFNHIWSKGFTTASDTTFVQSWAVASSKTGNIAQSGSFQGIVNLGDNNPVMSNLNGGGYDVFIVQRAP